MPRRTSSSSRSQSPFVSDRDAALRWARENNDVIDKQQKMMRELPKDVDNWGVRLGTNRADYGRDLVDYGRGKYSRTPECWDPERWRPKKSRSRARRSQSGRRRPARSRSASTTAPQSRRSRSERRRPARSRSSEQGEEKPNDGPGSRRTKECKLCNGAGSFQLLGGRQTCKKCLGSGTRDSQLRTAIANRIKEKAEALSAQAIEEIAQELQRREEARRKERRRRFGGDGSSATEANARTNGVDAKALQGSPSRSRSAGQKKVKVKIRRRIGTAPGSPSRSTEQKKVKVKIRKRIETATGSLSRRKSPSVRRPPIKIRIRKRIGRAIGVSKEEKARAVARDPIKVRVKRRKRVEGVEKQGADKPHCSQTPPRKEGSYLSPESEAKLKQLTSKVSLKANVSRHASSKTKQEVKVADKAASEKLGKKRKPVIVDLDELPLDMEESEMREIASDFGTVLTCALWTIKDAKRGVLEFADRAEAEKAVQELDTRTIAGWDRAIRAFMSV